MAADPRRRPVRKPVARPKDEEPAYKQSKSYKFLTAKSTSRIFAAICLLAGLLPMIDYWGPRTTVHETVLGTPNAGNYFLIRTNSMHFVIDPKLQYDVPKIYKQEIDVEKSISGYPLAFSIPKVYPGEKFYPLSTRYDYIGLCVLCFIMGLVLLFYPKYNETRIGLMVFGCIALLSSLITMYALQSTIESIYSVKTMGW